MKKIFNIVGARPNFMKIAPIHKRMQAEINRIVTDALSGNVPPLWDGHASERIVELITNQV